MTRISDQFIHASFYSVKLSRKPHSREPRVYCILESMNVIFHYYVINFLAREAGFTNADAELVAYSSQYVDNNIVSYNIKTGREEYKNFPTQNYGFWSKSFPKDVYVPFHFFPGDPEAESAQRKDGKTNPYNCTPNSSRAKEMLISALKSRNLYRLGIALHTFADTWAHQNFTGLNEDWNRVENGGVIPPIGHAQVIRKPDIPAERWSDPRLRNGKIVNIDRFMEAAKKIFRYLCLYNKKSYDHEELILWQLKELLIGKPGKRAKSMEEVILDFQIQGSIEEYHRRRWLADAAQDVAENENDKAYNGYDKILWAKDHLLKKTSLGQPKNLIAKPGFYDSHYYKWTESSRDHRNAAARLLKDLPLYSR